MRIDPGWKKKCLAALKEGLTEWNQLREDNPKRNPDLSNCKFENENFDGWDFSTTNFTKTIFVNISLKKTTFIQSNMSQCRFERSILSKSSFERANLRDTHFYFTDMEQAIFTSTALRGTVFSYVNMENINLSKSSKYPKDSTTKTVKFTHCEINWGDFRKAELQGTVFDRCRIRGATFSKADMTEATFECCNLEKCIFRKTNLSSANLVGAQLRNSDFECANLTASNFNAADLTSSNLYFADMLNCNFCKAQLTSVKYNQFSRYRGILVDNIQGGMIFQRFALDQKYIEEFRPIADFCRLGKYMVPKPKLQELTKIRNWPRLIGYTLWLATSNCGRSAFQWILISIYISYFFACRYSALGKNALGIDSVFESKQLIATSPTTWKSIFYLIAVPLEYLTSFFDAQFWEMFYYSIVTFTTLGYGDIFPKTYEAIFWVSLEVGVGYIMLGILISIMANKFARRSG